MIRLVICIFALGFAPNAFSGWQGFHRSNFNNDNWKLNPDMGFVSILSSNVRGDQVSAMSPYSIIPFDGKTSCQADWRAAWIEITKNKCNWNSWGPVANLCDNDFVAILPCEDELLGLTPAQLRDQGKGMEEFLVASDERNETIRRIDSYSLMAYEKAVKIYTAFHEKQSNDEKEAYKASVRTRMGKDLDAELLRLDGKRTFFEAYKVFSTDFSKLAESGILSQWKSLKEVELPQEKIVIGQTKDKLSASINSKELNWDVFRSNEVDLNNVPKFFDEQIIKWESYRSSASAINEQMKKFMSDFRSKFESVYLLSGAGENQSEPLLAAESKVQSQMENSIVAADRRIAEIRNFRSTYVAILREHQTKLIERIALNEKNLYVESRRELERSQGFTSSLTVITSLAHEKPQTLESIPLLGKRYKVLRKILEQEYQCQGNLESWKVAGCEIAQKHFSIAKKEKESLQKTYLKMYAVLLKNKAAQRDVNFSALSPILENQKITDFDAMLEKFDLILEATVGKAAP